MSTQPRSARRLAAVVAVVVVAATLASATGAASAAPRMTVIVRGDGAPPSSRAIEVLGGTIVHRLHILDGYVVELPSSAVGALASVRGVASVTPDAPLRLLDDDGPPGGDLGSMAATSRITGASTFTAAGITGAGVDVALIDSGVVPVKGLRLKGKVVNGPDLSFESQSEHFRYLDTFGHGTHMAGIIAGRDYAADHEDDDASRGFAGIAPGARVVSVKVATADGATDVSQVLAAIDWVVTNRRSGGLNIRVVNLSFGTDGTQDYRYDPLSYAVEQAWHQGIVVVVAAGNAGFGSQELNNPAYNPFVLAVGASQPNGTLARGDDTVASFSSRGTIRHPDLVAPGKSIRSLRSSGSYIDTTFPEGRVGKRLFRGSGTSQAAAVVSGAAALLIEQRPSITPDGVKGLLTSTADVLSGDDRASQGAGLIDLAEAFGAQTPGHTQTWTRSDGTGSLEAARGSVRVQRDGVVLEGEKDIFGASFDSGAWAPKLHAGGSWSGGDWNGNTWSGSSWSGSSWSGSSWSGSTWSGSSWSGSSWSGSSWSGISWSGCSWSGGSWSGNSWSGSSWSGSSWSGGSWSAMFWGNGWSSSIWGD